MKKTEEKNKNLKIMNFCFVEKTGLLWPYFMEKKALSASSLTKNLRELEYEKIPKHILEKAATRGKKFHKTIQDFIEKKIYPEFINEIDINIQNNLDRKIYETINFLRKSSLELKNFIGSEKLHYIKYKEIVLATYLDLEFEEFVIELKTNSLQTNKNSLSFLIFEIQLLIQSLCTGKIIYLLWSTGKGIIFNKFKITNKILKILDILIDLNLNEEIYTKEKKSLIIKKIKDEYLLDINKKKNE